MAKAGEFRTEKDTLGTVRVPARALYGAQTQRAVENFPVSSIPPKRDFIAATGHVKLAAARANHHLGLLEDDIAAAIEKAAGEVISGEHDGDFVVDVYQAGAGTSHNMNANEVIANRANEILGGARGVYSPVHPNDHVNMAQSTNDTVPTAMRVAALLSWERLADQLRVLEKALAKKGRKFRGIVKSGRTHLQDAVPVTLGGELSSYASSVAHSAERIKAAAARLKAVGLGATAAGTGMNSQPGYRSRAVKELARSTGIRGIKGAANLHEAINSMADFSSLSGALKDLAVELARIANDFRLLSSGPRTGLGELKLPPVQPGSSIMPGKVNPVMAEMLNMVSFQVIGNDLAVTMAAQAGQLDLNVFGPVINHNILQSMEILGNGARLFADRCVSGIEADRERCRALFESSVGLATVLNPLIGYDRAAEVARESQRTGRSIREVVLEKGILTEKEWKKLSRPHAATRPFDISKLKKGG